MWGKERRLADVKQANRTQLLASGYMNETLQLYSSSTGCRAAESPPPHRVSLRFTNSDRLHRENNLNNLKKGKVLKL